MPTTTSPAIRAPAFQLLCVEPARAFYHYCLSHYQTRHLESGDPIPVIVYPGLISGASTTARLRSLLDQAGFITYDWDQGVNKGPKGDLDAWLAPLEERLLEIADRHQTRVGLVGWSLGGLYARELAKRVPEKVRAVVTLGTPIRSFDTGTHAGGVLQWINTGAPRMTPALQRRLAQHPRVPTTGIYSRHDGVVAWESCAIRRRGCVEGVEVEGLSHLGMCWHPKVLQVIANRLRQDRTTWRPFQSNSQGATLWAPGALAQ